MPEKDVAMPIGAVTRLTGLSSHTLRKWESRYNAVQPVRTESGRRLYTHVHVRRLRLLKDLVDRGHQISRLAGMADDELELLLAEASPRQAPAAEAFDDAVIVGEALTEGLREALQGRSATLVAAPATRWLAGNPVRAGHGRSVLLVELPTVPEAVVDRLIELQHGVFARVIAVYGFAARRTLRRLLDGGIVCLKAPVNAEEIVRNLRLPDDDVPVIDLLAERGIPAHRFSAATLGRLVTLTPKLQCECPNHIAQLLLDISAFEQYSLECEDTEPGERALHARLRTIAATARALFEEAMVAVAANEGISLNDA